MRHWVDIPSKAPALLSSLLLSPAGALKTALMAQDRVKLACGAASCVLVGLLSSQSRKMVSSSLPAL
jgi:hypothetical protein